MYKLSCNTCIVNYMKQYASLDSSLLEDILIPYSLFPIPFSILGYKGTRPLPPFPTGPFYFHLLTEASGIPVCIDTGKVQASLPIQLP